MVADTSPIGQQGHLRELSAADTLVDVPFSPNKTKDPVSIIQPSPAKERTLNPDFLPSVIPPTHTNRTLVLCFDGTGDQFDEDNSNIVNLCSLLKRDDRTQQMVYYQTGIGTYSSPKAYHIISKLRTTLDTMIAWDLDTHVMDGYEFLMQNYQAGDRICIFGFSRGAYTARSLAGMLHKVGLLPPDNRQQVPFAYKMYTRADRFGWEQSNRFKRALCLDVKIEFMGVWDTVDSVGIIPRRLPFTTSNTIVRTFRHALSLDEHRAKFKANLWNRPTVEEQKLGTTAASRRRTNISALRDRNARKNHSWSTGNHHDEEHLLRVLEERHSVVQETPTDIEEVWFAGCHTDVGGGSVNNSTKHSLARITLRWMVRECFKANSGIMFDSERLNEIGLDGTTIYPFVTPRPGAKAAESMSIQNAVESPSKFQRFVDLFKQRGPPITLSDEDSFIQEGETRTEEDEELEDAVSPIYDQLKLRWIWWILELVPMIFRYQDSHDHWVSWFGLNLARPREIPCSEGSIKVHRSVKLRMEASGSSERYQPRPTLHLDKIEWVD